jgi:hypothetical protein
MSRNTNTNKAARKGSLPTRSAPPTITGDVLELLQMLTYCRPAHSKTEAAFCAKYIDILPGCTTDKVGNRIVTVGVHPHILWSSHTDTVHHEEGKQRVMYGDGVITLHPEAKASCLGADCTTGVWLMRQMIARGVPGLYIFHAAEEIGGIGSDHIADTTPHLLDGIDYAIAFDRRGTTSVVTHQMGRRCASETFANYLADVLSTKHNTFKPDSGGTFTDTANYTALVPECTNISVGYTGAHSSSEAQDVRFLLRLRDTLCTAFADGVTLPVERVPGRDERDAYGYGHFASSTSMRRVNTLDDMEDLVFNNPWAVSQMLEELGVTPDELAAYIENVK